MEEMTFPQYFNEDYEITGILGKGGMGYVYKAIDKQLNREVAFKVLEYTGDDDDAVQRFRKEAEAMKDLHHQNLVLVYDFGREGDYFFIAMTYVEGPTLSKLLNKRAQLDPEEVILIGKQLCRGLLYAHRHGIIHRDIKPSNIIISPDNRVYITDFGISLIQNSSRLTTTGMAMGTPEYMSPEQCQGNEITFQTDIYGVGIVLYEMLTGKPPFTGSKPLAIAYKHVHEAAVPPSQEAPDCPKELDDIVLKCLAKSPEQRYQSIEEVLEELDTVGQDNSVPSSGTQKTIRRKTASISLIDRKPRKGLNTRQLIASVGIPTIVVCLAVLIGVQAIMKQPPKGLALLRPMELSAHYVKVNMENPDQAADYTPLNIIDNDLQTAWIHPHDDNSNPVLQVRMPSKCIITGMGFAVGYQKSLDDHLQDRFTLFQKPREIYLRTVEGISRRIKLQNVRGVQYPGMRTFETTEFQLEFRDFYTTQEETAMALSELRIMGISMGE